MCEGEGAGFVADLGDQRWFPSVGEGSGGCCGGGVREGAEADDMGGQAELPDYGAQLGREGGELGKGGGHFGDNVCVFMAAGDEDDELEESGGVVAVWGVGCSRWPTPRLLVLYGKGRKRDGEETRAREAPAAWSCSGQEAAGVQSLCCRVVCR